MIEHPTYADTDTPMLIGDIVIYKSDVYEIRSMSNTSTGIIVSGSAHTGQAFSTDAYDCITKATKECAEAYHNPKNTEVWKKAFEIAKDAHATICEIKLSSPDILVTCQTIYLFGLVPEGIDTESIAPWAVWAIRPTTAMSVEIKTIGKQYGAPNRMLKFAENIVTAYESHNLMVRHQLWLVPRNAHVADWHETELDAACKRLEKTYHKYTLVPRDVAPHIDDMCDLFQANHPDICDNPQKKRALDWWRGYAEAIART